MNKRPTVFVLFMFIENDLNALTNFMRLTNKINARLFIAKCGEQNCYNAEII